MKLLYSIKSITLIRMKINICKVFSTKYKPSQLAKQDQQHTVKIGTASAVIGHERATVNTTWSGWRSNVHSVAVIVTGQPCQRQVIGRASTTFAYFQLHGHCAQPVVTSLQTASNTRLSGLKRSLQTAQVYGRPYSCVRLETLIDMSG